MVEVENAAQAPTRSTTWRAVLFAALDDLSMALEDHIATVEAPGGIIERVVADAPRLDSAGKRLSADHEPLRRQVAIAINTVRAAHSPPSDEDVETIHKIILELVGALSRHRQRGSDFVWEAYDVDIGSH
jgi:hypothetical protein